MARYPELCSSGSDGARAKLCAAFAEPGGLRAMAALAGEWTRLDNALTAFGGAVTLHRVSLKLIARGQARLQPDQALTQACALLLDATARFFRDNERLWQTLEPLPRLPPQLEALVHRDPYLQPFLGRVVARHTRFHGWLSQPSKKKKKERKKIMKELMRQTKWETEEPCLCSLSRLVCRFMLLLGSFFICFVVFFFFILLSF